MPIQLTTPFNPGDLDPGVTYPLVSIIEFRCDVQQKRVMVICQYGNVDVDGAWVPGKTDTRHIPIDNNKNADYDTLVYSARTLPADEVVPGDGGHSAYVGTGRALYQWLIDNAAYDGVVIP